ncbi:Glyoxylate/hydroxypyruvate reductase B [Halioglobus japonicus]|nr:Glyoxylate/hydroxypyruvate reductase B [Halioglobus japonicus]
MRKRVVITYPLPPERLGALANLCDLDVLEGSQPLLQSLSSEQLASCNGLICLLTDSIDRALVDNMPNLQFVSSVSVGVDHIDVEAMTARNIPVGHTPGVLVDATADTAFALLLAAARRVAEGDRYIREGNWGRKTRWSPDFFLGKDVSGGTLGIIGLGAIGQAVARRAAGFGMSVLGWTPSGRKVPGVDSVSLEELLLRSDFVSVHLALAKETRNLLDAAKIATMKPGAVLVNTARGGIVDESALVAALNSGHLYAAGLDVFEREPIAMDDPLLRHPRVVAVPHIGSATTLTRAKMVDLAIGNAAAVLQGQPMPHCVNPGVYTTQ